MTTLNARASEAWNLVEAESEFGFESDQDAFEEGWETGYKAAAAESAPRPVLDREAALKAIEAASNPEGSDNILGRKYVENWADVFTDAVMELARPMPTWEQIREHLELHWAFATDVEANEMTNAVLALFNGSES